MNEANNSEPPLKKSRTTSTEIDTLISTLINSEKNLKAIVNKDYDKPLVFVKVYIGQTKNFKDISNIINVLNKNVPLKELSHLKRVRKKEVLLCQKQHMNSTETIQEYIQRNAPELVESFEYFREIDVPLTVPKLKKQYIECNSKHWSVNFHPDKNLERLFSDNYFPEYDLRVHRTFMAIAFDIAKWYLSKTKVVELKDLILEVNAAVVVDPNRRSVVAVGFDNRDNSPIQHAAMLAIDNVAKTQNGGAWDSDNGRTVLSGIDSDLLEYLKKVYSQVSFGARQYLSKAELGQASKLDSPYLCTGYDIYLQREPCLMCAMALVHARVKRVFFAIDNVLSGALKSKTKLQCVESLNHHFDVFTGFL